MWRQFIRHKLGLDVKDKGKALKIKQRLAMLYGFIGWNCFGITFYLLVKNKMPSDPAERRSAYKMLSGTSTGNMHVYQVTGLKLKEFDVKFSPEEENNTTEIEKETTKVDEH
ncbi:hypothetical protein CAJAP_03843 [Camponotus japonicus]